MIKRIARFSFLFYSIIAFGQKVDLPTWGHFSDFERSLKVYEKDSTANAVVLNEVGHSYVKKFGEYEIVKKNYIRIKILNKEGFKYATVEIPTYKEVKVKKIKASTTNFDNGKKTVYLDESNIYKTKISEDWHETSFTLPNLKKGSIIEYSYEMHIPYYHTFGDGWIFQSEIPKIKSSYYAKIPGFWDYHISKINLKNTKPQQYRIINKCMTVGNSIANCLFIEYTIDDIPAFIEEDFMTTKYNYLKQLKFELKTFTNADLSKTQITKTWDNVNKEIFSDIDIGKKFGKTNFFEKRIPSDILSETNQLIKAKKIFSFIQNHYNWNGDLELFKDFQLKKAFEKKVGNMTEINMSLINALKAAGIKTNLSLLSTRDNGFPINMHPVISDFNYLLAQINIDGKEFFLDAVDKNTSFGLLPFNCLNGKIRVFENKQESYWYDYKPLENNTTKVYAIANITNESKVNIKARVIYSGYKAYDKREIINKKSIEEYKDNVDAENEELGIVNHTINNLNNLDKPLIEIFEFESDADLINNNTVYLKPFVIKDFKTNPFTLNERQYPVDLGYKRKFQYNMTFNIPDGYKITSVPKNRKMHLPENGGTLIYLLKASNNKITINFTFFLDKIIYQPNEYNLLKEFVSQLIVAQNEMIVLTKE